MKLNAPFQHWPEVNQNTGWSLDLHARKIQSQSLLTYLAYSFHEMHGSYMWLVYWLTHWGREMHICVGKLTIIASDNGLSPGWRQAIIWTNAGILLIGPLGTNCNEILIEIHTFSFKKMHLKMSSAKWRPCCLGLNMLTLWSTWQLFEKPQFASTAIDLWSKTVWVKVLDE